MSERLTAEELKAIAERLSWLRHCLDDPDCGRFYSVAHMNDMARECKVIAAAEEAERLRKAIEKHEEAIKNCEHRGYCSSCWEANIALWESYE